MKVNLSILALKRHITYDEANHCAQVSGSTPQIEEGESRLQLEGLHHLRVYAGSGQVYVSVFPRQVLIGTVPIAVQIIVAAVYGPKRLLHFFSANVLSFLQVIDEVIVVLPGAHSSPHDEKEKGHKRAEVVHRMSDACSQPHGETDAGWWNVSRRVSVQRTFMSGQQGTCEGPHEQHMTGSLRED